MYRQMNLLTQLNMSAVKYSASNDQAKSLQYLLSFNEHRLERQLETD